jgi:hypothetical protein
MREKLKNLGLLNLGKELSNNDQKKISGGYIKVCCSNGGCYGLGGSSTTCANGATQFGYCSGTGKGSFSYCIDLGPNRWW